MADKIKVISNGKMDIVGWKKVGKSFLISLAGAAIVFLAQITDTVDFGGMQATMATFLPFIVNFLKIWLGKYESK